MRLSAGRRRHSRRRTTASLISGCQRTGVDAARYFTLTRRFVERDQDLGEHRGLDRNHDAEQRLVGTGVLLALHGHRDGECEVVTRVVTEHLAAEVGALPTLAEEQDHRLVQDGPARRRLRDPRQLDAG
jgi:hypothetical protein